MDKHTFVGLPSLDGKPPKNCKECPECRGIPAEVVWEPYRSCTESWMHLAGREGYLIKCKAHGIEVGHHWTLMS